MIKIREDKTTKLPGLSSLYVTFDYNKDIVEIIKQCSPANYNKKNYTWEVPVTSLAFLLDKLCSYDEIELSVLETVEKPLINYDDIQLNDHKTKLYNYQEEGVKYGLTHDKWLLLDAPGLGKSLQIITLAEELKERENLQHCLIICGINTLKHNWKKEIEKHSYLDCRILGERVGKRSGKIIQTGIPERLEDLKNPINEFFAITNIESLRSNDIINAIKKGPNQFDMIVLDEAHCCKTPTSEQSKNFLKLSAKYQIALTGTVLTNTPLDAYVPLKWIKADNSTYTNFRYYYCNYTGPFNNILSGYKNINVLKEELSNISLRRTKDLLDLPEKNIIHEVVEMESTQQQFYDNIKQGIIDQVDKVHMSTANLLAMVARLRQATACPSVLTTENIKSSKLDRACELAEQIVNNGEKVIIFSVFKESLNILKDRLSEYNPLLCTGDVPDVEISKNIDDFQNDPDKKIILCTIAKMGTGITLTAASYEIFIDAAWTAAQNVQAEDRAYRIGTKKPVFIYYLWTENTIDMRVKELVEDKQAISDYVVDDIITETSLENLKKYIEDLK